MLKKIAYLCLFEYKTALIYYSRLIKLYFILYTYLRSVLFVFLTRVRWYEKPHDKQVTTNIDVHDYETALYYATARESTWKIFCKSYNHMGNYISAKIFVSLLKFTINIICNVIFNFSSSRFKFDKSNQRVVYRTGKYICKFAY